MLYTPRYKAKQLILGTGRTVIVSGWTVRKVLAAKFNPSDYAAIGQLYSAARGLNILVRNLMANPQVRNVVVLSATEEDRNAQSCDRVWDFWQYGVTESEDNGVPCWRVISEGANPGFIDIDVPEALLCRLRRGVQLHWCNSLDEAVTTVKAIATGVSGILDPSPWHPRPLVFPFKEPVPNVFPGPRYGHRIEGQTIAETWVRLIHRIKTTGTIRPTGYDGYWQELINLTTVVTDEPEDFYFPEPNYLPCDRAFIEQYIPQILEDAPYREEVKYTYGQRLRSWFGRDQMEQVVAKLIGEIDAASAVMSLWDVADHEKGGSPCLNHIWLRVVDGALSLTALFRSNDMFSAWPANAMGLRALQQHIRDRIAASSDYDLKLGPLMTISQSAHIYDDCWDNADRLIRDHHFGGGNKKVDYTDPAGDFLITVEDRTVRVVQAFHLGAECQRWEGRNPLVLMRQIALAVPHIQTGHALYLGGEIQRACACLKDGREFVQDRG